MFIVFAEVRFLGQADVPLNATGFQQATVAAEILNTYTFDQIVASPLQRALVTAQIIARATKKPLTIIDEFKECSFGIMQGQYKKDFLEQFEHFKTGGSIQGAELWSAFVQRVAAGLKLILDTSNGNRILIVSHGGVYRAIKQILGLEWQEGLPNCHPVQFVPPSSHREPWSIEKNNNIPH